MRVNSSSPFQSPKARVVATIASAIDWKIATALHFDSAALPDFFEVRADLLLEHTATLPGSLEGLPSPAILTLRHPSEGGKGPLDDDRRAKLYEENWVGAVAFDVELACASRLERLINKAKDRGLACILSHHDFAGTPPGKTLSEMSQQAVDLGADLFKAACTTQTASQLCQLLLWAEAEQKIPIAAMGMGKLGKFSRPLLAQLGSQLNYGYLGAPIVSGQWPAPELIRLLQKPD